MSSLKSAVARALPAGSVAAALTLGVLVAPTAAAQQLPAPADPSAAQQLPAPADPAAVASTAPSGPGTGAPAVAQVSAALAESAGEGQDVTAPVVPADPASPAPQAAPAAPVDPPAPEAPEAPEAPAVPAAPAVPETPVVPEVPAPPADTTVNPVQPIPNGQMRSLEMEHEGKIRRYLLRIPNNYNPDVAAPILFGFGGWGDSPENFSSYNRMGSTNATTEAIIVYPEGYERAWEGAPYATTRDGEDIRFIKRIVDAVDADYRIDRSRVYAMGMSNGGGFTSVLGCHAQDTFAAVAMVSAAYYNPVEVNCVNAAMNALIMHGVNDKMMLYEGGVRHAAPFLPVRDVVGGYSNRNGCDGTFNQEAHAPLAERLTFNNCHKALELVKVQGDHTWFFEPDTAAYVWNFLSDKRL